MKLVFLLLALSIGCARPEPRRAYALPVVDGTQYVVLALEGDRRLVVAVDRVWSCTKNTCTVIRPPVPGPYPEPANCPCHLPQCFSYCDPGSLPKRPTQQTPTHKPPVL